MWIIIIGYMKLAKGVFALDDRAGSQYSEETWQIEKMGWFWQGEI